MLINDYFLSFVILFFLNALCYSCYKKLAFFNRLLCLLLGYKLTIASQGYILTSEIDGTIQMKSYLTGNPEIRLALNEDLSIGRSGGGSVYGNSYNLLPILISHFYI